MIRKEGWNSQLLGLRRRWEWRPLEHCNPRQETWIRGCWSPYPRGKSPGETCLSRILRRRPCHRSCVSCRSELGDLCHECTSFCHGWFCCASCWVSRWGCPKKKVFQVSELALSKSHPQLKAKEVSQHPLVLTVTMDRWYNHFQRPGSDLP